MKLRNSESEEKTYKGGKTMKEEKTTLKNVEAVVEEEKKDIAVAMLQEALQKGLDTETISRLLDLRDRIKQEQAKQAFIHALAQFQSELPPIEKDKAVLNTNGTVRYRYASYDKIVSTIKPYLNKYGLSYRFETAFEPDTIIVTCIVQHIDGHSEKTSFKLPIDTSAYMNIIQKYGASLTYGKRYSLTLALGLATEEDTDTVEEEAPASVSAKAETTEAHKADDNKASDAQIRAIYGICSKKGYLTDDEKKKVVSAILGKEVLHFRDLTKKEASYVIDKLQEEPF